jgi:hypothetical protein
VRYTLKTPYRDGTTHVIFEPEDFIARLAALVPKPRAHLTRYHGVFAPASPDRARIVPRSRAAAATGRGELPATDRQRAMSWAQRLKRVFAIDIETCRQCGGRQAGVPTLDELVAHRIDVVYGGPPCQGFSQIGPRDLDDPRNRLYEEFVRVIRLLQPRAFVMENVPNMVAMQKGHFKTKILDAFCKAGYSRTAVLSVVASDFGVPPPASRRQRSLNGFSSTSAVMPGPSIRRIRAGRLPNQSLDLTLPLLRPLLTAPAPERAHLGLRPPPPAFPHRMQRFRQSNAAGTGATRPP